MIVISPDFSVTNTEFECSLWHQVSSVVLHAARDTPEWKEGGWEGISEITKKLCGCAVTRNKRNAVEFIFDNDEDYTAFLLQHT